VVCDGLEEGVQGMKVGGKRKLIVNQVFGWFDKVTARVGVWVRSGVA
jgi:hypothetical protein